MFDHNHNAHHDGNTKLIENEHVELIQVDDDMEGGTCASRGQRRGTIRSEIFNNSENLLILQRNQMEKLLSAIEIIKMETESYQQVTEQKKQILNKDPDVAAFIEKHNTFLIDQIDLLKNIHDAMIGSHSSSQNNKTIKSVFTSPTTSLFLPHSSTPYRPTKNILKENIPGESAFGKSSKYHKFNELKHRI